ncbi:MAG: hypothetical protein KC425_12230 [Anaerolineales bacterium]|nr:hypothetical protein [Anaerolineales bacterium]
MTLAEFFTGYENSRPLFEVVCAVVDGLGSTEMRITKSQIAFWRRQAVVRVWIPGRYLGGKPAPLVLTFSFDRRDPSPRWKEIVEPAPGRYTHHLEIYSVDDVDAEVRSWLQQAWLAAA